eukprot:snap_masked-scaffold_30-processed-gene-2.58-mRNA-1 protein AED:1.00 eAED:1.00 QI:0/-1/0/0/-1/1/1/0/74
MKMNAILTIFETEVDISQNISKLKMKIEASKIKEDLKPLKHIRVKNGYQRKIKDVVIFCILMYGASFRVFANEI